MRATGRVPGVRLSASLVVDFDCLDNTATPDVGGHHRTNLTEPPHRNQRRSSQQYIPKQITLTRIHQHLQTCPTIIWPSSSPSSCSRS